MRMIELLAMDVDGTLTDGGIYISADGKETKRYDVKDGMAIVNFMRRGGAVALISGRYSKATELRASELGVTYVYNGSSDKIGDLKVLAESMGITEDQVVYVGDDLNDIDCLAWSGMGIVVADGTSKTKAVADWITSAPGGRGAIREVVDRLIAEGLR
ncbi:3-deoxy-D-manno-octulosonate 8-phosphate phosphatase, YrbI family [Dethiosulfovibrio peptidovorans DSM 11002]|uniref:3-deoxy-D-manno-octulosonate 8-phosphate phosphatase, YrbI family n=1 Tax=Dethiosulfovibrio peptidovorans DSM 11002 TaxID=469381 RepID=D2Z365_9BACT|nr:HAD hydrolase family protein [Dethiosulfovibrio peptidovorans]EFC90283.1 3-deoxy-D-manno-octulosonate 8-phosphate phosphatase, YrbI family [Dethiosulfovibrio peptidovorans DSM 11002]